MDEADAMKTAMDAIIDRPLLPPDYWKNVLPAMPKLDSFLNLGIDLTGINERLKSIFADASMNMLQQTRQVAANAISDSLKQISLGWFEGTMEPFRAASKQIIDASAVIRFHPTVIVSPPPASASIRAIPPTVFVGPPIANIYEETGTAVSSFHASGAVEVIGSDIARVTESARVDVILDDATLTATGTLTATVIRRRRSIDAWFASFTAPLHDPIREIRKLIKLHSRAFILLGEKTHVYTLERASAVCVFILADGAHIGTVKYDNGELVVSFPDTIFRLMPDLWTRQYQEIRFAIEQHFTPLKGARIAGAPMLDNSALALPASAQPTQQPSPMGLPTDPNDPRLTESGMNEDHRKIVAMTNQGKSPRQIHDIEQRLGKGYIDGVLHDVRHHHSRAQLVKPAQSRPKKSKGESK